MQQSPPPSIDSISPAPGEPVDAAHPAVPEKMTKRMRNVLLVFIALPYGAYVLWCVFLLLVFPSATGAMQDLLLPGVMSCVVGALVLLSLGALALRRVNRKHVAPRVRILSFVRVAGFLLPGVVLSALTPVLILREPSLSLVITDPVDQEQMVAPLAVTFSLEHAVKILANRNLRPVSFSWDFDGDGVENDNTVEPGATALYDRPGVYQVAVTIQLNNGTTRRILRRVSIPKAVFSVSPLRPGVEEPIRFSVAHLIDEEEEIREVQWDFESDGIVDTVSDLPDAAHTYLQTGTFTVTATVKFANQTQNVYERDIEIYEPEEPPFPVSIVSEPENLIGPAPLGTIFHIQSSIAIKDVIWDFGDGEKAKGERVGHNFQQRGVFQVKAVIHSQSGAVAQLSKVVRVVETLKLPDLAFDGSPEFERGQEELRGEVPVSVSLTPRTTLPLVSFTWEAPGATSVGSTDTTLQAIYRRPGTYTLTLVAQDPDGKVLRKPITLIVEPQASSVSIRMTPEQGVAPLVVRFDASETVIPGEEITGFEWLFGEEESAPQQRGALVEYTFELPGTFQITLKAYTTSGKMYEGSKFIVVRAPVLDACAMPSRTSGKVPLGVSFNMACTTGNPASILWDFGDGAQSDEQQPVHVFEKAGTYKVTLTVQDSVGSTSKEVITISAF
ncbi:hypothetical protein COU80_00085 [Candidatus Peregrinibacteria bacterium CG10_big_fil_rev_8_21_14_0_10_55_24]|nr:MAG: hypothetical protein COU80_00085 [Candidatus Peregrinibacteria bacterium CG10_big_fil_rev_8_21_14_0_10_55_24]